MATVNFSVPDDVKTAFDRLFKGRNKSAVIAEMMRKAVGDAKLQKRREKVFQILTERRGRRPSATDQRIRSLRMAARS